MRERQSALSLPKFASGWICSPSPGTYCHTSSEPSKDTRAPEASNGPSFHHSRLRAIVSHSAGSRDAVSAPRAAMPSTVASTPAMSWRRRPLKRFTAERNPTYSRSRVR